MVQAAIGASLQDMFANRETVTNAAGQITGDNSNATFEVGEPEHGGKPGGHSVWISWVAPADGVATFRTDGSSFDTLLSAYYFQSTNNTLLTQLQRAAENDDYPGIQPASLIEFGARAGQQYAIAVDGYYGAVGSIALQWSFLNSTSPPPLVFNVSPDQSGRFGDPVPLSVNMESSDDVELEWSHDDSELSATSTNLLLSNLQATNVGHYSLRIGIGEVRYFAMPVEVQINSEGLADTLARDKLLDALTSPLLGSDGQNSQSASASMGFFNNMGKGPIRPPVIVQPMGSGVVQGYSGSQIFDTTYATADPQEPPHCGVSGGASYWLAYQPPANGTIALDTIGSTFPTVLQAYTYNGTLTGYADLISLTCDWGSAGQGASRILVPVVKTRQYLIVVDGVNGARGIAWLNYNLDTNNLPVGPTLNSSLGTNVVVPGSTVMLSPSVSGSSPLQFWWQKSQNLIPGANSPSLLLTNVTTADAANYLLNVTNDLGTLAVTQTVRVVVPPLCAITSTVTGMTLSWPTISGQLYTVEQASSLAGPWLDFGNPFLGDGQTTNVVLPGGGTLFYRLRVQ
jgi:hypothetical protein